MSSCQEPLKSVTIYENFIQKKVEHKKELWFIKQERQILPEKKKICKKCGVNSMNENLLYAGVIVKWKPKVFALLKSRSCLCT